MRYQIFCLIILNSFYETISSSKGNNCSSKTVLTLNQSIATMKQCFTSLLFFTFLMFTACQSSNSVRLVSTNISKVVNENAQFSFHFDQPLVPDTVQQTWITARFLDISPGVEGKFRWTDDRTLLFAPDEPLAQSTNYTVKLNENFRSFVGQQELSLDLGKWSSINFHTPYPSFKNWSSHWTLVDGKIYLAVDVVLNMMIPEEELQELLSLSIGDEVLEYAIKNKSSLSRRHTLLVDYVVPDGESVDVKLLLQMPERMRDWEGHGIKDEQNLLVYAKDKLAFTDIQTSHSGLSGRVTLTANQEIKTENLSKLISIKPKVSFKIERSGNTFAISSGEFSMDKEYVVTIDKSIESVFNKSLSYDYREKVSFGQVKPTIGFAEKDAMYLMSYGKKELLINAIGISEISIEVFKIFDNNLLAFFKQGKNRRYYYSREYANGYYNSYEINEFGKLVHEEKVDPSNLEKRGNALVMPLNFNDKFDELKGIYVVKIQGGDQHWLQDSQVVSISNLGLVTKKGKEEVFVFVNSLNSAEPVPGAEVSFVSRTNQEVHTTSTNSDGVASFRNNGRWKDFDIGMVLANAGPDHNFIHLDKSNVSSSRFEVGGKRFGELDYDLYLYGEREIYRPGETVNIAGILRDNEVQLVKAMPIKLTWILPNGRELSAAQGSIDKSGALDASLELSEAAITGNYRLKVYLGNDTSLGELAFRVEEFMPDRIKTKIELDQEDYEIGDKVTVNFQADNFFGPPATNRNYELTSEASHAYFSSKLFPKYSFNLKKQNSLFKNVTKGKTDSEGKGEYSFTVDSKLSANGLLNAKLYLTVFDESGRPVNRVKRYKIYSQGVFFGVARGEYYSEVGKERTFDLAAVDKNDQIVANASTKVEIIRVKYRTVMERSSSGYYSYRSVKDDEILSSNEVQFRNGKAQVAFTPGISGRYLVRIYTADNVNYMERALCAYGWGRTESTSFEVNREGKVEISLDKEQYEVGDQAKILFETPFVGKLLVTLERDEVIEYRYLQTDKKSAELTIDLDGRHLPNVYVSATLFRPHGKDQIPITVAHGYQSISVNDMRNELAITVDCAATSRSKRKQTVNVKTEPNATYTIAVVDEGILQLTNYETPNPYDHFYQKHALGVQSADIYPFLFPELSPGALSGGGGYDMAKRVNPLGSKRVKLVRYWSGTQKADASGNGQVTFEVPQFSGDLRVMAVAHLGSQMASADKNMIVKDPVVVSTGIPRFLTPADEIKVPVTLSNTTDKPITGTVSIVATSPASIVGESTKRATIPPNSEAQFEFEATTESQIGLASFDVQMKTPAETFNEKIEVTVRAGSSLQKYATSGDLEIDETVSLNWNKDLIPNTVDGSLVLSRSPLIRFGKVMKNLLRYPHGCTEQTISRAFPQVFFNEIAGMVDPEFNRANASEYYVQEAIKKISNRRISSGGLAYWSGRANWWTSAYGLHFLHESQARGFNVNKDVIAGLEKYLIDKVKSKETRFYRFNRTERREVVAREIPYSLFVLALRGEPQMSTMNYYKSNPELLSTDAKYLLAAAYAVSGDLNKYEEVLPDDFGLERGERSSTGSFYSHIRNLALTLYALNEADPENPQVRELSNLLIKEVEDSKYLNTQEMAFSFMALGKVFEDKIGDVSPAEITLSDGKTIQFDGTSELTLSPADFTSPDFSIKPTGDSPVYYYLNREGLSSSLSVPESDSNLKVRREYLNREGDLLGSKEIAQNDLVVVRITLNSTKRVVENVVITDILPAGFEVENPRLNEAPSLPNLGQPSKPEHFDIRDDRVHLFVEATKDPKVYYYLVRAVTKGTFKVGPVSADSMYDGEYYSVHGAHTLTIK